MTQRPRIVWPGPGRITLGLLVIVPAAMASSVQATTQRWVVGVAVATVILLLATWRGRYLTTLVRLRLAMLRRRRAAGDRGTVREHAADVRSTALLRIADDSAGGVPTATIASYLLRYGIRCESVRITVRDGSAGRVTWVGLTLSAIANLAALQARSEGLPLRQTAEVALRRLADHLRELGCAVSTVDLAVPDLLGARARERWGAVDDGQGYVAAYDVFVDDSLDDRLAALSGYPAEEVWTAREYSGSPDHPTLTVVCAMRTADPPAGSPLAGFVPRDGDHFPAVAALHPMSTETLVRT